MTEQELIKYLKSLGLEIHTSTKARGHHGFCLKNRIDVSKNIPQNRKIPVLLHEFAHYIHSQLEHDTSNGGSLEVLFKTNNRIIADELLKVTYFVDENSLCKKLELHKYIIKDKIKVQEKLIKEDYPKFMRSKKFKEFEKYIKSSDAKYLLKYDRVKIIKGFWKKEVKVFTINTIEKDFPDMPKAFVSYLRLHSLQKKQSRISAKINKNKKYYEKPTELFARLVEGLYIDKSEIRRLAPTTYEIFYKLLNDGYYRELKNILN